MYQCNDISFQYIGMEHYETRGHLHKIRVLPIVLYNFLFNFLV